MHAGMEWLIVAFATADVQMMCRDKLLRLARQVLGRHLHDEHSHVVGHAKGWVGITVGRDVFYCYLDCAMRGMLQRGGPPPT